MARSARRGSPLGLLLAGLLAVAVAALIVVPHLTGGGGAGSGGDHPPTTVVRALVGSEKADFFADPAVVARFTQAGYRLQVDTAGSREMADRDLRGYDLAFPSDSARADLIRAKAHVDRVYVPFSSPMAIATFRPLVALLTQRGVVTHTGDHDELSIRGYLDLVAAGTRWSDLPGNTAFRTNRSILISTTNPRTSNSADLYLAIAGYVENGDNVVADAAAADRAVTAAAPLFAKQGYVDESSQEPFDDYLTIGMGKTPMAMIYEAQFRAHQLARDPAITADMTLLYPNPTIYAKHTVVPLDATGDAVGRLLTRDPELQRLAAVHGFRTADTAYGARPAAEQHLPAPPSLVGVADAPTAALQERMIKKLDAIETGRPG